MFFTALEGAYYRFYVELNTLIRKGFPRVQHDKHPKRTSFVRKVILIRDISIAHIGSQKARAANATAAMMWQPMSLSRGPGESYDLSRLAFGELKVILRDSTGRIVDESDDLSIEGLHEMDAECRRYLDEYDRVCADYLDRIRAKLPITIGDEQYSELVIFAFPK